MKIRFPRFSLMTAVVVMVAAGGLIWLNTAQVGPAGSPHAHYLNFVDDTWVFNGTARGWPWRFAWEIAVVEEMDEIVFEWYPANPPQYLFKWMPAIVDLLIALAILALVGIISETIVRRVRFKKMTNAK